MKTFLEICISADPQAQELLLPTLMQLGCDRFMNTDAELYCYTTKEYWSEQSSVELRESCRNLLGSSGAVPIIRFREIPEENWNAQWEKTIQPVEIGNRFIITPSWHPVSSHNNRIVIRIDPKMSFGTGYHETTRLVLKLLEHLDLTGLSVLDVGTGTGILAIASAKLGATHVVGIDIDDWAIANSHENVAANDVSQTVEISNRDLKTFPRSGFDLILSNITLNSHIEMLESYRSILRPHGTLLLSGLLSSDSETMKHQLRAYGFIPDEELIENEWIAISAERAE